MAKPGVLDLATEPLRQRLELERTRLRQYGHELLASVAGKKVAGSSQPGVEDLRHLLKATIAALVAVEESLTDIDYLTGTVRAIIAERERLFRELEKLAWLKPFTSQANFILCSVLKGEATELRQKLQAKGILVRYFGQPPLRNFIRISVGKQEHTDALIKALREIGG